MFVLLCFIASTFAACSDWVGATGALDKHQHGVTGTVVVKNDCIIQIDDFNYDGAGPDVFVWGVEGGGDLKMHGVDLGAIDPNRRFTTECFSHKLTGKTLDELAAGGNSVTLSIWCRRFTANFADVTLSKPSSPGASAAVTCGSALDTVVQPNGCPARNPMCLSSCKQLAPNYNVWWEVKNDMVEIELEADVDENYWVGLGISDPAQYGMIGSDVTITGFYGETGQTATPRAMDYFLTAKSQCNYQAGADSGVCPDEGLSSCTDSSSTEKGTNDVTFISGERVNGIQRIRYARKLDSGDVCDRPFMQTGATRIVWGYGPITSSNVFVVNIHDKHSPTSGATTELDVNAAPSIAAECMTAPMREKAPVEYEPFCVELFRDVTTFDVTAVDHLPHEYPDPPAWGVSFAVNGKKTPELIVRRGTKYTFAVKTTDQHPFYITDNGFGGRNNLEEKIFVGAKDAWGTVDSPKMVEWTPDAETPDLVYYQCWDHQKLGWKIHVYDADEQIQVPPGTAVCEGGWGDAPQAPTPAPTPGPAPEPSVAPSPTEEGDTPASHVVLAWLCAMAALLAVF